MVAEILKAAGIKERGSRFVKPPEGVYAVWFDDIDTDGADGQPPRIFTHNCTIELYSPKRFSSAEEFALQTELSKRGLHWRRQDAYWLETEQMYQVIYEFSYTEKRR